MTDTPARQRHDWVGNYQSYILLWGLPVAAMVGAIVVPHPAKTIIWIVALVWMGSACIANARRCGRTHCYYTGPFFLIMTIPVILHGFEFLPFGPNGWSWLATAIGVGGGGLWCVTENVWGRYLG